MMFILRLRLALAFLSCQCVSWTQFVCPTALYAIHRSFRNTMALYASSAHPPLVQGITLKIALDSTGAAADLAADKSDRFTCSESLDMVHRLRRDSDAVLVGRNTIQVDNPSLTVRRGVMCERQPLRVVLDPSLKLIVQDGGDYVVFHDGLQTVVYHSVHDVDE